MAVSRHKQLTAASGPQVLPTSDVGGVDHGLLYTSTGASISESMVYTLTSLVGSTYGPPAAVSCLCRDTAVRCSVVGPFLWPAWWPGTRYQTTFEIRRVLLTVFVVTWKLFFSRSTSVHSALGASRLCAIQIYYWHWRWHITNHSAV